MLPIAVTGFMVLQSCGGKPNPSGLALTEVEESRTYSSDSVVTLSDIVVRANGDSIATATLTINVTIRSSEGPVLKENEYFGMDLVAHTDGLWVIREHLSDPKFTFTACSNNDGVPPLKATIEGDSITRSDTYAKYHVRLQPNQPVCSDGTIKLSGILVVVVEDNLPDMFGKLHAEKLKVFLPDGTSHYIPKG